jgi:hypothetical protein
MGPVACLIGPPERDECEQNDAAVDKTSGSVKTDVLQFHSEARLGRERDNRKPSLASYLYFTWQTRDG